MDRQARGHDRPAHHPTSHVRLIGLLLALILAAAACSSGDPASDTAEDDDPAVAATADDAAADAAPEDEEAPSADGDFEESVLRVASFGGTHDDVVISLFDEFEEQFNVTIEWEPASATENVAKAAATASNPEFDVIFTEDTNQFAASDQGLLAPVDEELVPNYADLLDAGRGANADGVAYGVNPTAMFYQTEVFEENGWDPPTSWQDLTRPEFCNRIGITHPNVTYTLHAAQMLGGGESADLDAGIQELADLTDCVVVFEPSSAALEEKLQLGEYVVGVHGTIRLGPLSRSYPIAPVYPEEGTIIGLSMASAVEGAPNPEMAQRFLNWLLEPQVQEELVAQLSYLPTNTTVDATPELENAPTAEDVASWDTADPQQINDNRRRWAEEFDRLIAN